jgi:uncharacterized Zn finger protein
MDENLIQVQCPYCGSWQELVLDPGSSGKMVQDCEVCCNPWQIRVSVDGDERYVDVTKADGSEFRQINPGPVTSAAWLPS